MLRPAPPLVVALHGNADNGHVVYETMLRLRPAIAGPAQHQRVAARTTRPIRVGIIVRSFTFGGSETEVIELVTGADPLTIGFSGIAVWDTLPLPPGEPPSDGSFPPLYFPATSSLDESDPRIHAVPDFATAARMVTEASDVILTWGMPNLPDFLPRHPHPKIVVLSKDSGTWAQRYLQVNALLTSHYVANSTLAATAFPLAVRRRVKVIPNGINPSRIAPCRGRRDQRELWGLDADAKIVGYVGRIERDKGIDKTAMAIAELPNDWTAVFVGVAPSSTYAGAFAELCERLIPGRYRLLPWSHDIGSVLAALDVFCHPSEHEGFSNSIAEAWLAGVPTIYTAGTGAIPDVGELGISVPPEATGTDVARAILRAYDNSELAFRAKRVIEASYLPQHNVRRWTEYLTAVHDTPAPARVIALVTSESALWRARATAFDFCCLAIAGNAAPGLGGDRLELPVGGAADLALLARYARADAVLAFDFGARERALTAQLALPVIVASGSCDRRLLDDVLHQNQAPR